MWLEPSRDGGPSRFLAERMPTPIANNPLNETFTET